MIGAATPLHVDHGDMVTRQAKPSGGDWPLLIGLPVVAGTFVFAASPLGWWAFVVATLVYVAGYRAFELHRGADRTYDDLVVALATLPEIAGQVPPGHGLRSAATAHRIGVALGLDQRTRADVVFAARSHAVGRLRLDERGESQLGDADAARWSRAIVECAPSLASVADLVGPAPSDLDDRRRHLRAIVDVAVGYEKATTDMGLDPDDAVAMLRTAAPPEALSVLDALQR